MHNQEDDSKINEGRKESMPGQRPNTFECVVFSRILKCFSGGSVDDVIRAAGVKLIAPHRSTTPPEHHSQKERNDGREDELIPQAHSGEHWVV